MAVHGIGLCAGVGGFELALDVALREYRTRLLCEWDSFAASCLVARMAEKALEKSPIWSNCRSLGREQLEQAGILNIEEPLIVNAGFPCQPHSQAGSRKHTEDERWLWFDILRVANECAAEWLVFENVEGILSKNGPWDEILRSLAESGYDAIYDVYSAAGSGAPHLRRRVYLVAKRISHTSGLPLRNLAERGQGFAQASNGGDSKSEHLGVSLADPGSEGLERQGLRGRQRPDEQLLRETGCEVADPGSEGLEGRQREVVQGEGRGEEGGATSQFRSSPLADPDSERIEERAGLEGAHGGEPDGCDPHWGFPWPPGPKDGEGWDQWRRSGGPLPSVRRNSLGSSGELEFAADRLRVLGNGLVPLATAHAIRSLVRRAGWAE